MERQNSIYPLAKIYGGKETWVLEGNTIIAVLAQQWCTPKYIVSPESRLVDLVNEEAKSKGELHFHYWVKDDPDEVYKEIITTGNRPSRRGRRQV